MLDDARFALRTLWKRKGATLLLVLMLALGLAANAVIFNVLDAVVLRAFSFPNQERLVRVHETARDFDGAFSAMKRLRAGSLPRSIRQGTIGLQYIAASWRPSECWRWCSRWAPGARRGPGAGAAGGVSGGAPSQSAPGPSVASAVAWPGADRRD